MWSGEDGLELGLIDELGGYHTALALAREAAGIDEDEPVNLKLFPKKKSTFELFFGEGPDSSEKSVAQSVLVRIMKMVQPVSKIIKSIGLAPNQGVLTTPPVNISEK